MLSTLLRWELRFLRRDAAFWFAALLAVAALAFALANGARWFSHLQALGDSAAQVDTQARAKARALAARLDRQPDPSVIPTYDPRNPYGYAYFQMQHSIVLPPTPLAALATGQSDLLPSVFPLNPGTPPALLGLAEPENPRRILLGRFDAAFVVIQLLPLLIIALTHALLAAEHERGTLRLLLAQPVTLRRLLAGRLIPRLGFVLGLLALLAAGCLAHGGSAGSRFVLWFAVAFAYAVFWFALSLAFVARPGTAATHALGLAALWLALVVVVPAGINLAVKALHPVPSRIGLVLALRAATDEAAAERSQLLARYYEDHPEFAPKDGAAAAEYSTVRLVTNEKIDRSLSPVLAEHEVQLARQQALVGKLQFLSPALLAQGALAEAAGTGPVRHREFLAQAAAHHGALRAFFNPRILRKESFAAWDDVPTFRFAEESVVQVIGRVWPAIIALLAAAAALGAWAWFSLRRYTLTA